MLRIAWYRNPPIKCCPRDRQISQPTLYKTLNLIKAFRQNSNTPIVIFTYLNPIYNYGVEEFHKEAASHGADGILILDLPPDEQKINNELCEHHELVPIRLIAPTTPNNRIKEISDNANGFIYYVSNSQIKLFGLKWFW